MKNSEVKFLRLKMQNSGASNNFIHHIPLEAITEIKKVPAADATTSGVLTIKYSVAGSNVTVTTQTDTAGTQAEMNAMIDALEAELIKTIELAAKGSKSVVTIPFSEGNVFSEPVALLNAGQEGNAAKLIIAT